MGTSHGNWWAGRVRHGVGQYFMGTSPVFMLASVLRRVLHPPVVLGSLAILRGYFGSMVRGAPRYGDDAFRRFLRSYQWSALVRGKARATARLNSRQAVRWMPEAALTPPAKKRSDAA
jgi:hypothetical protein